ncbi:MAG: protein kinase domain-containing protein [Kofleriaceae bacterium]
MSVVVADQPSSVWWCTRCRAIYRRQFPFCPGDGGEVVAADGDPLIGTEVGQYTVEDLLGEGAMGRVYRARHKHLADRVHAIKVLIGDLAATQEMRMRFLNEARSASKLAHPNVVTVHDVGRTPQGLLFLAMELVEGRSLSEIIEDGPMEASRVVRLARGICDGLAHAHANGIVHRDLKPENVIVTRGPHGDEVPRIVDFGIAVSIDREDARLTATGMSMGTPGYVAPEQVSGLRVDETADQYALGVTMFEMLTGGALPFEGSAMEVASAKTTRDAPSVADRVPAGVVVPPALERIVGQMLARKPRQRFESIAGVGRMLARLANAPMTEVVAQRRSWPRRVAIASVAAIAAGALIGYFVLGPSAPPPAVATPHGAGEGGVAVGPSPEDDRAPTTEAPRPERSRKPNAKPPNKPSNKRPVASRADTASPPRSSARVGSASSPAPSLESTSASTSPPGATAPPIGSSAGSATRTGTVGSGTPVGSSVGSGTPVGSSVGSGIPAPSVIVGRVQRTAVSGSLSETDVRRALARIEPAIRNCTTSSPGTATVRFTVGDTRRPQRVRGAGVASGTLACLASAVGAMRLEVAPDVGDADVVVYIHYARPS